MITNMKPVYSGKVREIYDISENHLIIVTTDRVSAFDNILPVTVKNKGVVLNKLSNFFFDKTKDIIANHILDDNTDNMPDFFRSDFFRGRTVMTEKLEMLPYEFIVRGYMFGNMWNAYKNGESFCGHMLSGEYKLAQKLDSPVLTPALKHNTGHDEYTDIKQIENSLGKGLTEQIAEICFKLYDKCGKYALSKEIIIADTKFEFGINKNGELVLADEVFTPDSSRFWNIDDYSVGVSPPSLDKQLLRDWLLNNKIKGEFQFDKIPAEILFKTEQIYNECLSRLIG